ERRQTRKRLPTNRLRSGLMRYILQNISQLLKVKENPDGANIDSNTNPDPRRVRVRSLRDDAFCPSGCGCFCSLTGADEQLRRGRCTFGLWSRSPEWRGTTEWGV